MSTAVMSLGALQQHRPLQASLQHKKPMVMMLSPPHGLQQAQIVQPSNGACVIVSANAYPPQSPPHFTNLDACSTANTTSTTTTTAMNNNNNKAKNNNLNKVSRVGGGAVQKGRVPPVARTSVVVSTTATSSSTTAPSAAAASAAVEALRCKRRIQFSGQQGVQGQSLSFAGHQPASVARRNARERNRVKQVNNGFATLRSHIPPAIAAALQEQQTAEQRAEQRAEQQRARKDKEAAKKLSKVETLRMAVEYIRSLQAMLNETSENNAPSVAIKTENVLADSPNDFDANYEAALALSHYSMEPVHGGHGGASSGGQGGGFVDHLLPGMSLSPPCSDASSSGSPTPSYVSDGSVGASSTGYAPPTFRPQTLQCRTTQPTAHHHHHHHHMVESPSTPPDSTLYEPMSPEDEELLDVITWWQQTNW